jgi:cysteine-rich repeat protein
MRSRLFGLIGLSIFMGGCEQIIGAPPHRLWECPQVAEACLCGDNVPSPELGEECDDGNTNNFDGCSADCKQEAVVAIVAGGFHTCALTNHGTVKCWGDNRYGQLGIGSRENRGDAPNELTGVGSAVSLGISSRAIALTAGEFHTCALLEDGRVKCWGLNGIGQLGLGDSQNRGDEPNEMGDELAAVEFAGGKKALVISAGAYHTCVLLDDKSVHCWGANGSGQLGLGDTVSRGNVRGFIVDASNSVDLGIGNDVAGISAGGYFTCARLEDNTARCWGQNRFGQLGVEDAVDRGDEPNEPLPPVMLGSGSGIAKISSGQMHVCVEYWAGGVKCWGGNFQGQLGLGDKVPRGTLPGQMGDNLPFFIVALGDLRQLVTGYSHTCVVFEAGTAKCWGSNHVGQLGLGDTNNRGDQVGEMGNDLPELSFGAKKVTMVAVGQTHTCALLEGSSVKCWGGNASGQLGLGDTNDRVEIVGETTPTVELFSKD